MTKKPAYAELESIVEALKRELALLKDTDNSLIRILSEDFRQLADRSPDAIYQFDVESRSFSFFNKQFLSLYSAEEDGAKLLTPKSVILHIHPDDRNKVRSARTLSLQAKNEGGEVEYRYFHPDGSTRIMHDRWTIVRDDGGQPIAIEGYIRDNTWLRQPEKELERSMRNSPVGCYIVQNARLKYVNPEFLRITGYSESELIGTDPLDLVQQKYRDQARRNAISMLKGKRLSPYEFCMYDKSGLSKWILETATSIQYKGQRAALCYFMDITEAKQLEKERLAKEKLISVLELAGAVGHELNNPLQVVLTCTEKLVPAIDTDQRRSALFRLLSNNVRKMIEIISKFQNITKYASKDYVDGKKIFDIDEASAQPPQE
jgi:PAS domain S-box-containing protein